MKRVSQHTFNSLQKEQISHYVQSFIATIAEKPLKNKYDLLERLTSFAMDSSKGGGELILK